MKQTNYEGCDMLHMIDIWCEPLAGTSQLMQHHFHIPDTYHEEWIKQSNANSP